MGVDQIAAEALRLSPRERAILASSLWESLGDPYEGKGGSDEDAVKQAVARDEELESGKVRALSHQELMAQVRQ